MLEPPDHAATWEDVADTLQALDTSRTRVLDGLRVVVVVGEAGPTDGLARELRGRGGSVALIDVRGRGIEEAREIDPEVVLIDPEALDGAGADLARRLRDDPRLRWASVVRVSYRRAWPHGLPMLAGQIAPIVERDRALRTHVAEGSPYRCDVERIGPNRALRAVEGLGRSLKISSSSAGAIAEVVVADELVVSASWWETGPASISMTGIDALAAFLTMRRGRLEVRTGTRLVGANLLMPVAEALHEAGQQMLGVLAQVPTARYPRKVLRREPPWATRDNGFRPDDEITTAKYPAAGPAPRAPIRRSGVAEDRWDDGEEVTTQRLARATMRPPSPSPAPPDRRGPGPIAERPAMPRRVRPTAPRPPVERHPQTRGAPRPPRPAVPVRPGPEPARRAPAPAPTPRAAEPAGRPSPTPDPEPVAEAAPLPPPSTGSSASSRGPISSLRPVAIDGRRPRADAGKWPLRLVALAAGVVAMTAVGYLAARPVAELLAPGRLASAPARGARTPAAVPDSPDTPRTPEAAPGESPGRAAETEAAEPAPAPQAEREPTEVDPHADDLPANDRRAARALVERARHTDDLDRAQALFEAALERHGNEPRAMAGIAKIHLARGDAAEAVEWARDALLVSPRRASYHVLLGDALEATGDLDEARRAWRRADRLAPGRPEIRRRLTP